MLELFFVLFFVKPQTVDRIMDCWLGLQIEQYVKALCERAYIASKHLSPRSHPREVRGIHCQPQCRTDRAGRKAYRAVHC